MGFKKATKSQAKLRAAVFGPSGAGKTFTSLRVATGLANGGQIALIDTERGSASKYADRFSFDVMELEDQSIQGYVDAIKQAAHGGYAVLVIDSLSHGWQTLLEEVERLAKAKYRGNTWSAWSEGTPLQKKLVQAILGFPGHVIATMRSKTEWTTVDDGRGRKTPQRVGLAPEQGKGVEYEFDLLVEISTDHVANVIKDRTGRFQDKLLDKPGEEFGQQLAAWLADGQPTAPAADDVSAAPPAAQRDARPAGSFSQQLADEIDKATDPDWLKRTIGSLLDGNPKSISAFARSQLSQRAGVRLAELTGFDLHGMPCKVQREAPLAEQIRGHIIAATNTRTLGRMGDRIDVLESEGQITAEEADELRAAVDRRHQEIEPTTQEVR